MSPAYYSRPIPKLAKSKDHDASGFPKVCCRCGGRVLVSQAAQMYHDVLTGEKWTRHLRPEVCA